MLSNTAGVAKILPVVHEIKILFPPPLSHLRSFIIERHTSKLYQETRKMTTKKSEIVFTTKAAELNF